MQQRFFDFEGITRQTTVESIAVAVLPPPTSSTLVQAPPLVRPDRQLTYEGDSPCAWPPPDRDQDVMTVDRPWTDIDGPPHRFVIWRGDFVEVYMSPSRSELGKVVDISQRRQEVQVFIHGERRRTWFCKEQIYPAPRGTKPHANAKRDRNRPIRRKHDRS
jgi:hypothetical protein